MHYYEANFYGEGHEKDWSFYIKSEMLLTKDEVASELKNKYLGIDGLEQHHLDNIVGIYPVSAAEFTRSTGIEVS